MARRPVTLNPKVQEQLLAQMREEQAARARSRQVRNFVLIPLATALVVGSIAMMFSDDRTMSMLGGMFASLVAWEAWKRR
jgi:hypothetical protein